MAAHLSSMAATIVPVPVDHESMTPNTNTSGFASGQDTARIDAPVIKRRAPIACRRCRRMRSKCVHNQAQPPCKACLEAGLGAEDCIFPSRGQPDRDREFRHPRMRADKAQKRDPTKTRCDILDAPMRPHGKPVDEWDQLPPLTDIIDGINRFTRHYFQLGFIPKRQFPERLLKDHRSVSVFLVVSILSISARLSPALSVRYGSGIQAAEYFMERAAALAYDEIYEEPTLERCQAFYLFSIAQQGSGLRNQSYINMGISMRMASLMRLHREETYKFTNPTPEVIMRAESARRTLWMLHSQDQLHSGPYSPVSLAAADITALLPSHEADFASSREPRSRAAVEGTPPAVENPALITDPNRSLFASLIQAHHFWGMASRRAVSLTKSSHPWDLDSEFAVAVRRLLEWEQGLPQEHLWSYETLKHYKADAQDLAYLGVTMIPRLCNIVLRRPYLTDILTLTSKDQQTQAFFANVSLELFLNVRQLFNQISAQFTSRSPDESVGAQMAAFCVYSCGLFSTYLCRYPNICPDPQISRDGPMMLQQTISILMECKEVWPLASRWVEALQRFARDPSGSALTAEGGMADGEDPVPNPVAFLSNPTSATLHNRLSALRNARIPTSISSRPKAPIESSVTIQPSPRDILTPLSTPTIHMVPPQFPHPIPAPTFTSEIPSHLYIPSHPTDDLGMVAGAFGQASPYAHASGSPTAAVSVTPTTVFYPSADGFDNELQFYVNGPQNWVPSGVFESYQ